MAGFVRVTASCAVTLVCQKPGILTPTLRTLVSAIGEPVSKYSDTRNRRSHCVMAAYVGRRWIPAATQLTVCPPALI